MSVTTDQPTGATIRGGNATELARYVVEKAKPFLVVVD